MTIQFRVNHAIFRRDGEIIAIVPVNSTLFLSFLRHYSVHTVKG